MQQTNEELQEKARLLAEQNQEVERKNREVEQARQELEDKAKQLALTSKYKSEFLANMSHELRTPLNSLLILSDQLTKNPEGNLTPKQTDSAKTIHCSGNDLLMLINDILDLSKIESGTVVVEAGELRLDDLHGYVARTFTHVAESKNVRFHDPLRSAPAEIDVHRRQAPAADHQEPALQRLQIHASRPGDAHRRTGQSRLEPDNEDLNRAAEVLAFAVADTGIGIAADKQMIIFEAFQQADGSTSRKYGGTGLGLAISRELSRLLGGEIRLISNPGHGSTFTLYLPVTYSPARPRKLPGSAGSIIRSAAWINRNMLIDGQRQGQTTVLIAAANRKSGRLVNEVGDDRDVHPARRPCAADRRKRPWLRAFPARYRARKRLQGTGDFAGRRRAGADP